MNIRDFSKNEEENTTNRQNARELYEKYKDSSQDEIYTELLRRVAKSKQEGTFDKERLRALVSAIGSSLGEEQLKKINDLLDKL